MRLISFLAALFACAVCKNLCAQDTTRQSAERIARLHNNPAWDFATREFIETIDKRRESLQGPAMTLLGVVKLPNGQPAADAFVMLRVQSNNSFVASPSRLVDDVIKQVADDVFAIGWTDASGVFKFQQQPTPWTEPLRQLPWEVVILADGCAAEVREFNVLDARSRIEDFQLQPAVGVSGRLLDAQGQALPNVRVSLVEIINPYYKQDVGFADIEWSLLFSEVSMEATTDASGAFAFTGLPQDRIVSLTIERPRQAGLPHAVRVMTSNDMQVGKFLPEDHPRARIVYPFTQPEFEVRSSLALAEIETTPARRPADVSAPRKPASQRQVTVRVVDERTGEGVSGVGVTIRSGNFAKPSWLGIRLGDQATNSDGEVKLSCRPQFDHTLAVTGRRFGYVTHFERFSNSPDEYTPDVPAEDWIKQVDKGDQDIELTFRIRPIAKTKVRVSNELGMPVRAQVSISPAEYPEDFYRLPTLETDDNGSTEFSVRPVFFNLRVRAITEDGLTAESTHRLSDDFDVGDEIQLTVR